MKKNMNTTSEELLTAKSKLKEELTLYRNEMFNQSAATVYKHYMTILLMEATYHYTLELMKDDDKIISSIIEKEDLITLDECTKLVLAKAREIGRLGSLTIEDYYNVILKYFV